MSHNICLAQTKIDPNLYSNLEGNNRVRVIVVTRVPSSDEQALSIASQLSSSLGSQSNIQSIGDLPALTADLTKEDLSLLYSNPDVIQVFEDVPVPPMLVDSVPMSGASALHASGILGDGMTIAVLDTGTDVTHPALSGSVVAEACFSTPSAPGVSVTSLCPKGLDVSFVAGSSSLCPKNVDSCKHGTHVAAIIAGHDMLSAAAKFTGIAPNAKVLSVQVFSLFSDNDVCKGKAPCILSYTSDQLRALDWVYKRRSQYNVAAVNMSLGGGYNDNFCDTKSPLTERIERLKSKGIATIIAAGNSKYYDGISSPACISSSISVTGLNKDGELDLTYSNVSTLVDLAAPGTSILSAIPQNGYASLSGTSMAAPHVAGAFAMLKQKYPQESVQELENRLKNEGRYVVDARTDINVLVLDVVKATRSKTIKGNGIDAMISQINSSTSSLIIETETPITEIKKIVSENCLGVECKIVELGESTFRLNLSRRPDTESNNISLEKKNIDLLRDAMQQLDGSVKIYNNDLSSPF